MKLRILLLGLMTTLSSFAVLALAGAAQADPASAYWTFDEGAGTSASDSAGSNNGTFAGDASWSSSAKVGKGALDLHGHGSVDVPSSVIDTSQSFTVSAWVNFRTIIGYQTIVSVDGQQVSGFYLQLRDGGTFGLTYLPADSTQGDASIAGSLDQVKPNTWYHLIGVHDAESKVNQLYVNGYLQDTTPFTGSWRADGHLEIGRGKYSGGPADFVNGLVDDVKITQGVHVDPAALAVLQSSYPVTPDSMTIDSDQTGAAINPLLYGLMIEDISHSIDGGLYAELIRNRALKDDNTNPMSWQAENGTGAATIAVDTTQQVPGTELTNSLRLDISTGGVGVGVSNEGYWGIPVKPREVYTGSFYAKSDGHLEGTLTIEIRSDGNNNVLASTTIPAVTTDWKLYTFKLKTGGSAASETNKFVIVASGTGSLWLTQVSLFPPTFNNRPNGSRIDLMDELLAMHPKFLRLPGGNYLEGNNIADRFDWKKSIGPIEQRPGHNDPWGYRSTDGFGLLEYLDWCDDLNMEPVLAVYAGFSLSHQHVVAGPALQPFVQDALDEIQYLTGDKSTVWGVKRIADGHPTPFKLHYVEIGNEDFFDNSGSYDGRFAAFYDAIKAAYPNLKLIATANVKSRFPDLRDDHYYEAARSFEGDWKHYDKYDRSGPKVFVGEYASQEGRPTPNLRGALGDAAFMAGFERNADVIQIASYAPLLVNINKGASQWGTNLIGFDSLNSYVSPAYYTQQLFSLYHGDNVVPSTFTGTRELPYSVNKSASTGTLYIKVVNASAAPAPVTINLDGAGAVSSTGTAVVLSSAKDTDTNTINNPANVVPVRSKVTGVGKTFTYTFAPYSLTVLILNAK